MPDREPGDTRLRLRAEDAEDLAVISACLQDSLVAVRDLAYDPDAQTFILAVNRFRWEECGAGPEAGRPFERIHCGVSFDNVEAVAYRGFHRSEGDRILSLLAIRLVIDPARPGERAGSAGAMIDLEFAGNAQIRLAASAIRCCTRDFGEPWPTAWQPGHALDEMT